MREQRADHLSPTLERAVHLLREAEPVDAAWRERMLHAVAADAVPHTRLLPTRRLVPLRSAVAAAIAAAIVCAVAGSAITVGVLQRAPSVGPTASAPGSAPAAATILLPVHFSLVAPSAASVSIVGDFNHWSPTALPMQRSPDGRTWEIEVKLPEGRYNYAYLVDGHIARDPSAPQTGGDDYGVPSSVLMVNGT